LGAFSKDAKKYDYWGRGGRIFGRDGEGIPEKKEIE